MKKINNVTLCSISWGSKYIKETYEAYKKFCDQITFERIVFFVNDTTILPKEANQILLPEYFIFPCMMPSNKSISIFLLSVFTCKLSSFCF